MSGIAAEKLKKLRLRSGMTVRALAKELGYGEAFSTYSSYESTYKKQFLPPEITHKLAKILTGLGDPAIELWEIMALSGLASVDQLREKRPADEPEDDPRPFKNYTFDEVDVQSEAGFGAGDQPLDVDGKHVVLARWQMPSDYFHTVNSAPENVKIIRVIGDSMEPDYFSGERIMVDTAHRIPSPPAVYVLFDGYGIVLKQLEIISREPARVRVTSRNPNYAPYEANLDDININGRVIGKWTWK